MGNLSKKRICIFSHYFQGNYIPYYVLVYLYELKNYFDEILVVTNTRNLVNIAQIENPLFSVLFVNNEGYDFGMFYKAFRKINHANYEQIAFINDSNVVFGSLRFLFEWGNKQPVDFWGLVDSYQKPGYSTHPDNYHIQSHFIVLNKKAIGLLPVYMEQVNFEELIKISDISFLKKKVINDWEVGFTQFLLKNKLTCKTYIDSKKYSERYKNGLPVNVTTKLYCHTIADGVPVIKKRVITSTDLRHMLRIKGNWRRLIKKYGEESFGIENLIKELRLIRKNEIKARISKIFKRKGK